LNQVYAARYTVWHALIALCWFPIGLLAFLAPVKTCPCGAQYGAGLFLVNASKVLLLAAVVLVIAAILFVQHALRHITA